MGKTKFPPVNGMPSETKQSILNHISEALDAGTVESIDLTRPVIEAPSCSWEPCSVQPAPVSYITIRIRHPTGDPHTPRST